MERELIEKYFTTVDTLLQDLDADKQKLAIEIAALPMSIRGYGHVKHDNVQQAQSQLDALLEQWGTSRQAIAA